MSITTADLLQLQEAITTSFRHEIGLARADFNQRLEELKGWQAAHDTRAARHGRELAALRERTKGAVRLLLGGLTPKQRAAIWGAVVTGAGLVIERGCYYASLLIKAYVATRVHP